MLLLTAGALLAMLAWLEPAPAAASDRRGDEPPNILLIVTDDQRWDSLPFMPNAQRLVSNGRVLPNAFVPNPLCCPNRVSILTGNHSLTTGVYTNGRRGGFRRFHDEASIATALEPTYRRVWLAST
jgi:N-acetylglucosamine-6-sulfatase